MSFAFATLWKGVLSPEFLDGRYFHYTFLSDRRFEDFAYLLGGLRDEAIHANQLALAALRRGSAELIQLQDRAQLVVLARLAAWWTVAIEGLAAAAFLWPVDRGLSNDRHALLLVFSFTTYLTVDVSTFGWTLLTLGLAQCGPEWSRTRALYVLGCFVVLFYHYVPLLSFLRPLAS